MEKEFEILYLEKQQGRHTGIGRVFRQVAAKLDQTKIKFRFEELPFGTNLKGILKNLKSFRPSECDLYHITGDVHYMALLLPPERTVLTIHDLVLLRVRKGLRRYILKKLFYDLPVKRLHYITTISEQIKSEIIRETKCVPEKITVIENPLREEFEKVSRTEFNEKNPRLLQIGTAPNKNLANTFKGLQGLPVNLRIVGKINDDLQKLLSDSKIKYEVFEKLSDREIKEEYQKADIILFCSTYEGFGLPIIEGQAMKKCVVTSNLSPMREVAGTGACLVDPHNPEEIREGIKKIINNHIYRNYLIEQGEKNIARFESKKIARQYQQYYLKILS